jgi:hypothetical protein
MMRNGVDTSVIKYRDDIFVNVYLSGQRVPIFLLGIDNKKATQRAA